MPKTVVHNVFVTQVFWEAVPNVVWQQQSFCSQMYCVCMEVTTARDLSVDEHS